MSPQCEPEVKVLLGGLTLHCCGTSLGLNAAESESFPSPSTGASPGGKHRPRPAASPAECADRVSVVKCVLPAGQNRGGTCRMKALRWWFLAAALLALRGVDAEILDLISPHEDQSVLNHGLKGVFLSLSVRLLCFSASLCDFVCSCRGKEINTSCRVIVFQK